MTQEQGRQDGFTHAGIGAGDEDDARLVQT
jgi:hypothetical protein